MDINFKVHDEKINSYLALPAGGKGPGVLVLHAWWGLNGFFKQFCDRLAEAGFVALAPDMKNGEIASTVKEAEALKEKEDNQLIGDIVLAAKDYLLSNPACTSEKIGVIGFSMGAAWTVMVASRAADQVAAAVLFYGVWDFELNKIRAKIMGHFSDNDEWEPIDGVHQVEAELHRVGVNTTFHIYPGIHHWFMETDRPEYDPGAASLAWERTLAFLEDNLK